MQSIPFRRSPFFPLPPLAEQTATVARVEALMEPAEIAHTRTPAPTPPTSSKPSSKKPSPPPPREAPFQELLDRAVAAAVK